MDQISEHNINNREDKNKRNLGVQMYLCNSIIYNSLVNTLFNNFLILSIIIKYNLITSILTIVME